MKLRLLFLLQFFTITTLHAQNTDSIWMKQHYVKREINIPMRDGVRLFTSIYTPIDSTKLHPLLLARTPYSCAPYGEKNWMPFWNAYWMAYIKEGYTFVFQDVRGKFMSEGDFVEIRPFNPNKKTNKDIDEASDAYDTIDWLVKNIPGNNGKVGALGISYPGFYAAMTALSSHPALKAVSPQAPVTDWFMGDDLHHNGAFFLSDAFDFYVGYGMGDRRRQLTTVFPKVLDQPDPDSYHYFLKIGALPNFTKLTGDSIAFWNKLMAHPNLDTFWKARNDRQYVSYISPHTATLIVGGLFDAEDSYGAWNLYRAIEHGAKNNNKLVIGPWYHGQWSSPRGGARLGGVKFGSNTSAWYAQNIEIPFFDYYLQGKGNMDTLDEATIFFTGENKWHHFKQWPSADEKPTALYLGDNRSLHFTSPENAKGFDEYISDPANPVPYTAGTHKDRTREYMDDDQHFVEDRKDVLVYETNTLDNNITIGGPLTADLWVTISTTDADFVVKLIDVYPDNDVDSTMHNYHMLVRGDVFRGRYRNSFSKPEPFTPGKPTEIKYTMPDVAHTFKKGHKIMVQIQSSWFPLVDRNPQKFINIYQAKDEDFIKSDIKILHNDLHQSKMMLPVLDNGGR
jgi:putative CocE/NonD family hydrolase